MLAITLTLVFLVYFLNSWIKNKHQNKQLPPTPESLPIIGHIHMLSKNPHQDLTKLAKKYGPIMYMRFSFVPHIIISSHQAAEHFLKTNDLNFSSRPVQDVMKYNPWMLKCFTFNPYGPYWNNLRKLCTRELLSNVKIRSFMEMRKEEITLLVERLEEASRQGSAAVDLSAKIATTTVDMTCRMILGRKYEDGDFDKMGFKDLIHQGMKVIATPNVGDYFPYLGKLDLQGLNRKAMAMRSVYDDLFDKIIAEHEMFPKKEGEMKDFVDILLGVMESGENEFEFGLDHIKAILLEMLVGSVDPSSTAVEWTLAELLKHPNVMKRVQNEIKEIVGRDRMVKESDLDKLPYLEMVIKESLRLHPTGPVLIPRACIEDCLINGYRIPKDSHVLVNIWAIGRDTSVWAEPEKFVPERFIGCNVDLRGHNFQLLPFGSGRRRCPGMELGLIVVKHFVAQLVHCFDWELPDGMLPEELDMTGEFKIAVKRAQRLLAIPTFRLYK